MNPPQVNIHEMYADFLAEGFTSCEAITMVREEVCKRHQKAKRQKVKESSVVSDDGGGPDLEDIEEREVHVVLDQDRKPRVRKKCLDK